jgi:hypothetical protein
LPGEFENKETEVAKIEEAEIGQKTEIADR